MNKLTCILAAILTLSLYFTSDAQTGLNANERAITIHKTTGSIKLDGVLAETDWQKAGAATGFTQHFPSDTALAVSQTEARVCFDDTRLYIAAVCRQPNRYTVQSYKRDFPELSSDNFFVSIDPFGDKLNGFHFAVNPYGVQREAQVFNGYSLNSDWDNKWESVVKRYDGYWVVEMAIPFKSLRYKVEPGQNVWGINFVRINLTENERSSWVRVERNLLLTDMTFTGNMVWAQTPPSQGANVVLIPYLLGEASKNYREGTSIPKGSHAKTNMGLDAKIAVTPSLNLDLTVNPDFAQVDVDQQVPNLTRFELFFPERRLAFVENNDLFGSFGASFNEVRPFFSRRIGLQVNDFTGQTSRIPIVAGARLSGRLNKDWRVGLMNMQTAAEINHYTKDSLPAHNFLVAAVQRRVFKRSNISALFVNKQAFMDSGTGKKYNAYNRVGGFDFNYASESGVWVAKAFAHYSFQPQKLGDQGTAGIELGYSTNNWVVSPAAYYIGKNFNAETGFVPRGGILQHPMYAARYFYPKGRMGKKINHIALIDDYSVTYDLHEKRITDWSNNLGFMVKFNNTAEIRGTIARLDYTWLFNDFDPSFQYKPGFLLLPAGTDYRYLSHGIGFKTDRRKLFTMDGHFVFGNHFNGKIQRYSAKVGYRWQPYGVFSLNADYTRIRLPQGFSQADIWVVGAKTELTFSKNVFWTSFLQFNTQANNFNINSRLQWRFKPVSDLFLVYTDNYFAQDGILPTNEGVSAFGKKNKAIVLKFNYWFGL